MYFFFLLASSLSLAGSRHRSDRRRHGAVELLLIWGTADDPEASKPPQYISAFFSRRAKHGLHQFFNIFFSDRQLKRRLLDGGGRTFPRTQFVREGSICRQAQLRPKKQQGISLKKLGSQWRRSSETGSPQEFCSQNSNFTDEDVLRGAPQLSSLLVDYWSNQDEPETAAY
ncbi:hypothetical protein C8R43DRAFT_1017330 [Mycena crocata]|nr:hypothetical protein C8R43DRAFT_1017330 [Mycena crocata]